MAGSVIESALFSLSPGYLTGEELLQLHRLTLSPPEPWPEFPHALNIFRKQVIAELHLRGLSLESQLESAEEDASQAIGIGESDSTIEVCWPQLDAVMVTHDLQALQNREAESRIPAPQQLTTLWAQHKYSTMARDPARGKSIGARLGHKTRSLTEQELLLELVTDLRTPPPAGRMRNSIQHMWGYVAPIARSRGIEPDFSQLTETLTIICSIALEEPTGYLATSTALSDLRVWGEEV